MTEDQLLMFLSVDEAARAQLIQARGLGARLHLEAGLEEIVAVGSRISPPAGESPEDRLDLSLTVHAYRTVSALTGPTEVLVCRQESPRFDLTPAGVVLAGRGAGRRARTRLCPVCTRHPVRTDLARVTHDGKPASLQVASDWGGLTKKDREVASPLLATLLRAVPGAPAMTQWTALSSAGQAGLAEVGERFAQRLDLTFREYLELRSEPAQAITPAGLRRLQATPAEKRVRAKRRDERALARQWERDHR